MVKVTYLQSNVFVTISSAVFMQAKKMHKERKSGKESTSNSRSSTPSKEGTSQSNL